MTNLILCGGSGTRLWPISRTLYPKQFAKIFGDRSLFEMTFERNSKICDSSFIISNAQQYFLALDQLEAIGQTANRYLLEPIGRNTAPAIALACLALKPDEIVLVTPSDHLIKDEANYEKAIKRAEILAKYGYLVTFGIMPSSPNTGFGYIEANGEEVLKFHEKPDAKTAESYLKAGNFYWNSGIFMFKVGIFLNELKIHAPQIYTTCLNAFKNAKSDNPLRIDIDDMSKIPSDSIDYAVLEKSNNVKNVYADMGWSDLGSFDSLFNELEKDEFENTKNLNHLSLNSSGNLIFGTERKIATIDVDDMIVVDTRDALLICKKGSTQKVKDMVDKIKYTDLTNSHITTHRHWGSYTVLENAEGYKIKRIEVKPGKRLSLQKHYHRNEHWIVVSGTATVTLADRTFLLRENESTYIKMGEIHRLANEGKIPVVLIEAQVGEYTGEDDIVRIEDDFERQLV